MARDFAARRKGRGGLPPGPPFQKAAHSTSKGPKPAMAVSNHLKNIGGGGGIAPDKDPRPGPAMKSSDHLKNMGGGGGTAPRGGPDRPGGPTSGFKATNATYQEAAPGGGGAPAQMGSTQPADQQEAATLAPGLPEQYPPNSPKPYFAKKNKGKGGSKNRSFRRPGGRFR